jgi:hypothetical protein
MQIGSPRFKTRIGSLPVIVRIPTKNTSKAMTYSAKRHRQRRRGVVGQSTKGFHSLYWFFCRHASLLIGTTLFASWISLDRTQQDMTTTGIWTTDTRNS